MQSYSKKEYSFSILILFLFFIIMAGIVYLAYTSFVNDGQRQGVTGTLLIRPVRCVPSAQNSNECLTAPVPSLGEIVVRRYGGELEGNPSIGDIVKRFQSKFDGSFQVGLPEGVYCFTSVDTRCHKVEVKAFEWSSVTIRPF